MSAGELSLASDEWAWLRTPDFLRARAADVTLPWWPMTSASGSVPATQPLLLLQLATAAEIVVVDVVVVVTDDDSNDDVNVLSSASLGHTRCHNPRVWQTDRQTDRRTDTQTEFSSLDRVCIPCGAV